LTDIDVTDGSNTVTGVDVINFTSGATVTANGTTAEVSISGGSGGSGVTKYAFLVKYNGNALGPSDGSITQITDSPYVGTSTDNVTVTITNITDVSFEFNDPSNPPVSIYYLAYDHTNTRYTAGNIRPVDIKQFLNPNSFTSVGAGFESDILTNFNGGDVTLDLTYADLGGTIGLGVDGHVYLIFSF